MTTTPPRRAKRWIPPVLGFLALTIAVGTASPVLGLPVLFAAIAWAVFQARSSQEPGGQRWHSLAILAVVVGGVLSAVGLFAVIVLNSATDPSSSVESAKGPYTAVLVIGISILLGGTSYLLTHRHGPAGGQESAGPQKRCPECAELVQLGANVCRYCGHRFALSPDDGPAQTPSVGGPIL